MSKVKIKIISTKEVIHHWETEFFVKKKHIDYKLIQSRNILKLVTNDKKFNNIIEVVKLNGVTSLPDYFLYNDDKCFFVEAKCNGDSISVQQYNYMAELSELCDVYVYFFYHKIGREESQNNIVAYGKKYPPPKTHEHHMLRVSKDHFELLMAIKREQHLSSLVAASRWLAYKVKEVGIFEN